MRETEREGEALGVSLSVHYAWRREVAYSWLLAVARGGAQF